MAQELLENFDLVSIAGEAGVWTIVGTRDPEPRFKVQLGLDGASVKYVNRDALTLVQKASKPDSEPGFYPATSITG